MINSEKNQLAISQFESGDYRGAFLSFAELFQECDDEQERAMIFQILQDGYYQPNEYYLKKYYQENCEALEHCPFQIGFRNCPWEELPVQLFPISETEYCLFDRENQTFSELRSVTSDHLLDYLFEDLSRPIFQENECNLYHLKYLWDNVRRSEDFGGDNHIYVL